MKSFRVPNKRTMDIIKIWDDPNFKPEHVMINRYGLCWLALKLADSEPRIPSWLSDQEFGRLLPQKPWPFISYLPYICAVNFSFVELKSPFRRFKVTDETGEYYGSQAMFRCFHRRFGEKGIDAESMLCIASSEKLSKKFFAGQTPIPLLNHRRYFLTEIARVIQGRFDGDPMKIFDLAGWKAFEDGQSLGLIETLEMNFPKSFGADCAFYADDLGQNFPLRFSKRAQLLAMIYQGRALAYNGIAHDEPLPVLSDAEDLGPIADSAVPNALRNFGALQYSPELKQKMDKRELLDPQGPEVKEIRMATVVAVEELLKLVNSRRNELARLRDTKAEPVSILALDSALWKLGRNLTTPAHLSRTTDY